MFGFLNIYKPVDITSHDVVSYLRKITDIKKIGHTGTLDPLAQGILPVCIGKSTRLIEYLQDDKAYTATIQFGKSTTTFDKAGEATFLSQKKYASPEILAALKNFEGEILQKPPIFSALKVNGKKLYEYAREGKDIEIKSRTVKVFKIELLSFDAEAQTAEIFVESSKGTYIRSIADDLGKFLGVGGHLTKLIRIRCGDFDLESAVNLYDLKTLNDVKNNLINPLEKLNCKKLILTENEHKSVMFGKELVNKNFTNEGFIILIYDDKINAIAKVDGDKIVLEKVFNL